MRLFNQGSRGLETQDNHRVKEILDCLSTVVYILSVSKIPHTIVPVNFMRDSGIYLR